MMNQEPILVCGTGIAGLACALGLARAGLPAALLGPRQVPAQRSADDYHPRLYAISPASRDLLDRLGAWRLMDARRITAVETMEIQCDADGRLDLSAWQDARDTLAWTVESGEIERALQQAAQVMGIAWHEDRFERLETRGLGVRVTTGQGRVMDTPLLVGADGARSPVRLASGIEHHTRRMATWARGRRSTRGSPPRTAPASGSRATAYLPCCPCRTRPTARRHRWCGRCPKAGRVNGWRWTPMPSRHFSPDTRRPSRVAGWARCACARVPRGFR